MLTNEVASKNEYPTNAIGLRACKAVARDRGISDVTLWRWARRGWIKTANICGRPYVVLSSLAEFDRRATAGEFSKPPAGAAKQSAEVRAARDAVSERGLAR
jgi:hypothetical protein